MNNKKLFERRIRFWSRILDEVMLVEGKHWPEDYIKAAVNKLKAAGKYDGDKTDADVEVIA